MVGWVTVLCRLLPCWKASVPQAGIAFGFNRLCRGFRSIMGPESSHKNIHGDCFSGLWKLSKKARRTAVASQISVPLGMRPRGVTPPRKEGKISKGIHL